VIYPVDGVIQPLNNWGAKSGSIAIYTCRNITNKLVSPVKLMIQNGGPVERNLFQKKKV